MSKVGYTRIDGPDVLPTKGAPLDCKFSPVNGTYLAVVGEISPSLFIYKRSGDVFTKITDPIQSPSGYTAGCAFSTDGVYLAVAGYQPPYLYIYKRIGDTFTKLPDPEGVPTAQAYGCAFGGEYLAVVGEYGIHLYKKNDDEFTKISKPKQSPSVTCRKCAFSADGTYLAIVSSSGFYLYIFKKDGDSFTRLDNPAVMPTGAGLNCAFTPDGSYLVVTYQTAPYLTVYKRSGNSFVAMSSPTVLPTGPARGCALTSRYMAVAHWVSPYLRVYELDEDEDVYKTVNITGMPLGDGFSCAFTPDGEYLAVGARPSLFTSDLGIYKRVYSPVIQGSIVFRGHASANFGNPIKTATGKITFRGRATLHLIGLVLRKLEGIYQISSSEIISRNQPVLSTDLANYIEVWINPRVPANQAEEVYRSKEPEPIPPGGSKTFSLKLNKEPVIEAVASLEDAGANLSIIDTKFYSGSAEITVRNSGATEQTCIIVVQARPLELQGRRKIVVKDEESILDHGLVKYTFDSPLVQDEASARDIGEKILRLFSVARANIEIEWRGDPALELADIVQIPEFEKLGVSKKENFYVTRQLLEVVEGGLDATLSGRKVPRLKEGD